MCRDARPWLVLVSLWLACGEPGAERPAVEAPSEEHRPDTHEGSEARSPVARLVAVAGDVRIRRAGEVAWAEARAGEALLAGDAVQTMEGGRAVLAYEAGPEGELEEHTMIVVPAPDAPRRRLTQLSGLLVARIDPGSAADGLDVELPPGVLSLERPAEPGADTTIEARVAVSEIATEIEIVRGRARLTRRDASRLELVADRFVRVAPDGAVLGSGTSRGGIELLSPEPDVVVRTRDEVVFRWSSASGVSHAEVRVTGEDGVLRTAAGEHGFASLSLVTGAYEWSVLGRLGDDEMRSGTPRRLVVDVDREAPRLQVLEPVEGARIEAEVLSIRGRTEPGAHVELDGTLIPVEASGTFAATRRLPRGLSHLVFRSWDALGNQRTVSRSVARP